MSVIEFFYRFFLGRNTPARDTEDFKIFIVGGVNFSFLAGAFAILIESGSIGFLRREDEINSAS
jgi:hypothetical protein